MDVKKIHIGKFIEKRWEELQISQERTCNFFKCSEDEIQKMFKSENLDTLLLLKWSKILEYDFFRLYSHHLILYAPPASLQLNTGTGNKMTSLPRFRKNVYTRQIIFHLLHLIKTKEKTISEIIKEYNIPKTTIYRWQKKYS